MSGVHGQVLGHLVKRGYDAAQSHFSGASDDYIQQLKNDAQLYDNAGPEMEVKPQEMLPVFITALVTLIIIASVRILSYPPSTTGRAMRHSPNKC